MERGKEAYIKEKVQKCSVKFNIKSLRAYFPFLLMMLHGVNYNDTTHVLESFSFTKYNFVNWPTTARLFTVKLVQRDHFESTESQVLFIILLHE